MLTLFMLNLVIIPYPDELDVLGLRLAGLVEEVSII
jgi:hypothetical protein